jgi:HTH-type transcriptional regulator, sugar sensing transcriptional regulator
MAETTTAVEHLQAVGFSEYEARAYVTLVERGPLTGYQLAKESGIPRPNIYPVIDRLEQRGAAVRIETGGAVKYDAGAPAEMLGRLGRSIESHLGGATRALEDLTHDSSSSYVWNVEGYEPMLERARTLLDAARERVLLGLWSQESAQLSGAVAAAQARGVHVVTLCIEGCAAECGNCRGDVYRYAVAGEAQERWLTVIADDREALIGQVARGGEGRAAQTTLSVVVAMAAQYLRNTIAAAEIARSLGSKLPKLLDRGASRALTSGELGTGGQSWLRRIAAAVRRDGE